MQKILIVEDEEKIARFVELELKHEGYDVDKAYDGRQGLELAESGEYNLILLDIMLPGINGIEILRRIRKNSDVPVIMLTARDAVMDKVSGLDMGADDYITKPFSNKELIARIKALLRRSNLKQESNVLIVDNLVMNLEARTVEIKGKEIKLRPKEFDLLHMFLLKPNNVLTREFILENVFEYNVSVTTRTIDTHIKNLRQALGNWGNKIKTIFGRGFKFVPESK